MLLRAEGPVFCAGYGLDWATAAQAREGALAASASSSEGSDRVWGTPTTAMWVYRMGVERANATCSPETPFRPAPPWRSA